MSSERRIASMTKAARFAAAALFGSGAIGLRMLATGLPASVLLDPRRALASGAPSTCTPGASPQFVVFSTSGQGDPINAGAPGTYADPKIVHSTDPTMAATPLSLGGQSVTAAAPWAALPQAVLDRTSFRHLMTDTPVHPKRARRPRSDGCVRYGTARMLPSILAKALAPCLGTVQTQPLSVGAASPAEGLTFDGEALPIVPPLALRATLSNPAGPLTNLQALRDQTMSDLYALYRSDATPAGRAYIDSLVTSQQQVRGIKQALLDQLALDQGQLGRLADAGGGVTLISR